MLPLRLACLSLLLIASLRGEATDPATLATKLGEEARERVMVQSDYSDATEAGLRRLLALLEAQPALDPVLRARATGYLGLVLVHRNRFDEATATLARAHALADAVPNFPENTRLQLLGHDATLAQFRGQWSRAAEILTVQEAGYARLEPDSVALENVRFTRSIILTEMGDYPAALAAAEQVLAAWEKRYGPNDPRIATVANNIGAIYQEWRGAKAGLPYYARATAIAVAALPPGHRERARVQQFYGGALLNATDYAQAATVLADAAADWAAFGVGGEPARALIEAQRTRALIESKADPAVIAPAWAAAEASFPANASPRFRQITAGHLTAAAARLDPARAPYWAERTVDAILEQLTEGLSFTAEPARLALLLNVTAYDAPGTAGDPRAMGRALFATKALVLDSLLEDEVRAARSDDPAVATLRAELHAARTASDLPAVERLEAALARIVGGPAQPRRALTVQVAEIQSALGPGEVLLDFVRFTSRLYLDRAASHYGVVIATADRLAWVDLGLSAPINEAIERVRLLATTGGKEAWAHELRALVFDPLRPHLPAGLQRIHVVPEGRLQFIPWAALPDGTDGFLADLAPWITLDSARDLLSRSASTAVAVAGPPLVLAAPVWTGALAHLAPLPGAAAEGRAVSTALGNARLLTGADATPAALAAHRAPVALHLATHSLWPSERATRGQPAWQQATLALAGDEGALTPSRIAALDLQGTRIVAISACESGGGTLAGPEGILGLRRGFARAGAQRQLFTLWPVPDHPTGEFFSAFYQELDYLRPGWDDRIAPAFNRVQRDALHRWTRQHGLATALRHAGGFALSGSGNR